jgi:amino acid adenylation domain-containing protein
LPLMSEDEVHNITQVWNRTGAQYGNLTGVVDMLQARAATAPAAVAFLEGNRSLSTSELNSQSNQVAHYLQRQGVMPGAKIGLLIERSLAAVVPFFAIFKAGGVYVPLDPSYPQERLYYMIEDSAVSVLLTTTRQWNAFSEDLRLRIAQQARVVLLDALANELAAEPADNLPLAHDLSAPAYVIYTSGSTGRPKGSIIPHRQVLNRLVWMWRAYPLRADEVGCHKTALSFVDSLWELFGYVLQGIPVAILPDAQLKDPHALVNELARHRVTRLWLVPSLLRVLVNLYPKLRERLPKLDFWVVSGEAMPIELTIQFKRAMSGARLYNIYGTSEVWDATWFDPEEMPAGYYGGLANLSIGKPIANVRTYILDERRQPVPIGVRGELYVGGVGLSAGYIGLPELTAKRFLPDPFSAEPGARIYRTGDVVRYWADGHIEFVGRTDFQVKVRGFRVELDEIEMVLNQYPGMEECAVIAAGQSATDPRIIAFYRTAGDATLDGDALRDHLTRQLPNYMLPSYYIRLESFPKTPSGKISRKELQNHLPDMEAGEVTVVAAKTEVERVLVKIWEDLLQVESIGVNQNFFELGGHSILAMSMVLQVEALFRQKIRPEYINEPTIAHLARLLEEPEHMAAGIPAPFMDHNASRATRGGAKSQGRNDSIENRRAWPLVVFGPDGYLARLMHWWKGQ